MILLFIIIAIIVLLFYLYKRLIKKSNNLNIYVINLNESKDRLNHFNKQTFKLNNKIIRFPAIDGKTYKLNEKEKYLFKNSDFNFNINYGLTGCALSHYYLWKKIVSENIDKCIICEDDIIFNNNFSKRLLQLNNDNYDIIFLYNTLHNKIFQSNNSIIKMNKPTWYGQGAVIYIINNKAARFLVNKIDTMGFNRAVDWFMLEQYKFINIGVIQYPLVKHANFKSVASRKN